MAQDPYKYFRVEARELLEQLGRHVLDLEKSPAPELVQRILRLAHTLKGAARVVKQGEIAEQAHAIEDTLAPFRDSAEALGAERIGAVLRCVDLITHRVASLGSPAPPPGPVTASVVAAEPIHTVRAEIAEMDALLDGLAEAHAELGTLARAPGLDAVIATRLERIGRELHRARDVAERMRLVPAGAVFVAFERAMRDSAQTLERRVRLDARGGDVGLDAHVLDAVRDALVQLARNAVAHGIEAPAERARCGKPEEGRITLAVVRRGDHVVFRCHDDGRGIDFEEVRRVAQRAGRLASGGAPAGSDELVSLLLNGGISTAVGVTAVAGRGVGLDVVRETARRLGGEARIESRFGAGTTVELIVPLSITSLEVVLVTAAGVRAAVPLAATPGVLLLTRSPIARTADGEAVTFAGEVVPLAPLSAMLSPRPDASARRVATARPVAAILVRGATGTVALGVDRVHGVARVVMRPLPALAPASPIVAGVCLDAEGSPQLVLEPDALVVAARRVAVVEPPAVKPRAPVLVVDDSLTTRMLEQSILESAGYEVDVATSGEEALTKARRRSYALFLVDVEMPGMDGFTFIETARADAALRDIPAILVTSRSAAADRKRGEAVGARGYVVKGEFDQTAVLRRIQELVG